jgi:hypothetical protein
MAWRYGYKTDKNGTLELLPFERKADRDPSVKLLEALYKQYPTWKVGKCGS